MAGVGFHRMPFGGGDSPNIRVDFPTVFGRFGESPPQWVFTECPYRWVFTECPLGVVIHRMYHKTVGYHP